MRLIQRVAEKASKFQKLKSAKRCTMCTRVSRLRHLMLYTFQHRSLPENVLSEGSSVMQQLETGAPSPLLHCWSQAQARLKLSGTLAGNIVQDKDYLQLQEEMVKHLSIKRIRRNSYCIYLIAMPHPMQSPEAYYVAVVKPEAGVAALGPRYFTLEKSPLPVAPLFCEWQGEGNHLIRDQCIAPDETAFLMAVERQLKADAWLNYI